MTDATLRHGRPAKDTASPALDAPAAPTLPDDPAWWRHAVIYQVYVRSFADGNGDGTGDLAGVRARLPYLRDLGVDAIWFTPWYVSPLADGGYDVADYRAIDPAFGTLAEAEALIAEALELGIRTIVDVVPNHVSDRHPWFQAALAAGPGSPERERFWFRPGRGANGDEPPTGWVSSSRASPWTPDDEPGRHARRVVPPPVHGRAAGPQLGPPRRPGRARGDPPLLVRPRRRRRPDRLRGAAGQGPGAARGPGRRRAGRPPDPRPGRAPRRSTAAGARSPTRTPATRVLVGEIWLADAERFARYLRPDELHTAFNFDFMARPWDAASLRDSIDATLAAHAPVGAPATWVLSNHDVTRPVTRYGRDGLVIRLRPQAVRDAHATPRSGGAGPGPRRCSPPPCPAPSTSTRATSSGSTRSRSRSTRSRTRCTPDPAAIDPGRDGCRVPLPWSGDDRAVRVQPGRRVGRAVAHAAGSLGRADRRGPGGGSRTRCCALYRAALRIRRAEAAPRRRRRSPGFRRIATSSPSGAGMTFISITNLSGAALAAATASRRCCSRAPTRLDGHLPPDATVWLRPARESSADADGRVPNES